MLPELLDAGAGATRAARGVASASERSRGRRRSLAQVAGGGGGHTTREGGCDFSDRPKARQNSPALWRYCSVAPGIPRSHTARGLSRAEKRARETCHEERSSRPRFAPHYSAAEKPSEKPSEHILAPDALLGRASNVSDVAVRVTRPCACGRIQLIMWTCRAGCPCGGVCYHLRTTCRVRLYIIVLRLCRGCESLIWKNKNDAASRPCSWCGACRLWLGWL